jgi:tripartite-type tricarboxylate transporter receptor subunit TctC
MKRFTNSRRVFVRNSAALLGFACPTLAGAQSESAATRVLCTGPAGSIPDIVARRFAEQMAPRSPAGVLVENRPGAAGQIAVGALRQANANGSTLLLAQGAIATVYPYLYTKLPYDPAADLQPVSMAAETHLAFAVGPAVPENVSNLRDFANWSRGNPKLSTLGSPGAGTLPHLLGAMYFREAQLDWQHVPYSGGPQAIVDLLGGRIAAIVLPEGLLRPQFAAGKLRLLATSGATRSNFLPGVPSFVEQGFPNLVVREWFAFFMPGSASAPVVENAAQVIRTAAAGGQIQTALSETAMFAVTSTPAVLSERIATEQKFWQAFLSASGIRAE